MGCESVADCGLIMANEETMHKLDDQREADGRDIDMLNP